MNARLVNESIDNLLKPKSDKDIIRDLSNLTQEEKDERLIDASRNGRLEEVKMLIEAGADINTKNEWEDTSLMFASYHGYIDLVKLLIEAGADINAKNNYGSTALIYASAHNHKEIVKLLLEAGADIDNKNKYGNTSLILASKNDNKEIVDLLKNYGAKLIKENIGNILKPKSKEDINNYINQLTQKEKDKKLFTACVKNQPNIVKLLIEAGANVNAKNDDNFTSLMFTSYNGYEEIVKLLIDTGANVSAQDKRKYTALIYATQANKIKIVKLLIEAGADINARDNFENTALTYVYRNSNREIIDLLKRYGAKDVNESLHDILKPKSYEDIKNIQKYFSSVLNYMLNNPKNIYSEINNINIIDKIQRLYHISQNFIKNNYNLGISPEETANKILKL